VRLLHGPHYADSKTGAVFKYNMTTTNMGKLNILNFTPTLKQSRGWLRVRWYDSCLLVPAASFARRETTITALMHRACVVLESG